MLWSACIQQALSLNGVLHPVRQPALQVKSLPTRSIVLLLIRSTQYLVDSFPGFTQLLSFAVWKYCKQQKLGVETSVLQFDKSWSWRPGIEAIVHGWSKLNYIRPANMELRLQVC